MCAKHQNGEGNGTPLQCSCPSTPVLLPGNSHGQRSLIGCSPWGREDSDRTERLPFHFSLSSIGEGNGNPLQCSCLQNHRDGGAWWAAVHGVAESETTEATLQQQQCPPRVLYVTLSASFYSQSCSSQSLLWMDEREINLFGSILHSWRMLLLTHTFPFLFRRNHKQEISWP